MADKADWTKISPKEVEKIIVELARQGMSAEKIGLVLRDQHGLPKAKLLGVKISKVLKENNLESDSEKKNIQNKIENLKKHSGKNKHDYTAIRKTVMYTARINRKEKLISK